MVKWTPKSRQRIGSFKVDLPQPALVFTIVMPARRATLRSGPRTGTSTMAVKILAAKQGGKPRP